MANHFKVRAANGKRGIVYLRWRTWWLDARAAGGTRQKLEAGKEDDAHQEAEGILLKIGVDDTLGAALKDYSDNYRRSKRPSTINRTLPILEGFVDFVGPEIAPSSLAQKRVQAFVNKRRDDLNPRTGEKIRRITIMNEVACIRTFTRVLRAQGKLMIDPCLKIEFPEGEDYDPNNRREKAYTVEEMEALVNGVEGNEFAHDWVVVGLSVGLRPAETSHARGIDLDEKAGVLYVRGSGVPGEWRPKTKNATRALDLSPEALAVLSRRKLGLTDKKLPMFHSETDGLMDFANVRRRIVKYAPNGFKFGLYRLRHTFAVRAREAGWPLERISAYMGHCSVKVTEGYAAADARKVGAPPVSIRSKQVPRASAGP